MHGHSPRRPITPASLRHRDRPHTGFTDQSHIARTDRDAHVRGTVTFSASRVQGEPRATKNQLLGGLPHLVRSLFNTRWRLQKRLTYIILWLLPERATGNPSRPTCFYDFETFQRCYIRIARALPGFTIGFFTKKENACHAVTPSGKKK